MTKIETSVCTATPSWANFFIILIWHLSCNIIVVMTPALVRMCMYVYVFICPPTNQLRPITFESNLMGVALYLCGPGVRIILIKFSPNFRKVIYVETFKSAWSHTHSHARRCANSDSSPTFLMNPLSKHKWKF